MIKSVPPRLRRPLMVLVIGAVLLVFIGTRKGWGVAYAAPIVVLVALLYYVWGGREGDLADIIRIEADERQVDLVLRVEALIGRVLGLAVLVSYGVAVGMHATLWPFAVLLAVPVITGVIGWFFYHDRNNSHA